jgi:hypothetical protein
VTSVETIALRLMFVVFQPRFISFLTWRSGIMARKPRFPSRFPVGTHYILEGEPADGGKLRIISRYLVMPSGVRYDLVARAERARKPADLARKGHASTPGFGATAHRAG